MILNESHRKELLEQASLMKDDPVKFEIFYQTWTGAHKVFLFQEQATSNFVTFLKSIKDLQAIKQREEAERKEQERQERIKSTFGSGSLEPSLTGDAPF